MLNNKKNIIIAGLVVLILITALILALTNLRKANEENRNNNPGADNLPAPEFLTAQEKADFRLDDGVKAQVLSRNASGAPTVYRLINTEADIVMDPSKIGPISPRQLETAK